MAEKTIEELQAYHDRLITDVRRSQLIDPNGLRNNTPLMKNLRTCEEQIKQKQQSK